MLNLIILAAAASANITVSAPQAHSVMVDGSAVQYQAEQRTDGTRRIYGQRTSDRTNFDFIARPDGRVYGTIGHEAVVFDMNRSNGRQNY